MSDLITALEYTDYKGLTAGSLSAQLTYLIPAASNMVEQYCNNHFISANYSKDYPAMLFKDHEASQRLYLDVAPVATLTSITNPGDPSNPLDVADFYLNVDYGFIEGYFGIPYSTTGIFSAWRIAFTGGAYANIAAVPKDIKLATFLTIDRSLDDLSDISSITISTLTVSYEKSSAEMIPKEATDLLAKYIRIIV